MGYCTSCDSCDTIFDEIYCTEKYICNKCFDSEIKKTKQEVAKKILEDIKKQSEKYDGLYIDERITDVIEAHIS